MITRIVVVIVGVLLAVLLSRRFSKRILSRNPTMSEREATKRGLLTVAISFSGVIFAVSVGSSVVSMLSKPSPQYDINDYLPKDLVTNPAVWSVSNGENQVYLVGTIHASTDKTFPLPDYIMDIYNKCDCIVLENYNAGSNRENSYDMYKLPNGNKITDFIDKNTYSACRDFLKSRNAYYPDMNCYNANYWYGLTLSELMGNIQNIDLTLSVDSHFANLANADGKEIVSAESEGDGIGEEISDKLQEYFLAELMKNADDTAADFAEMYTAWASGDIDFFTEEKGNIPVNLAEDYEKYRNSLIDSKNVLYATKVEEMLESEKSAFMLFGTAHFAGENGIISILENEGYSIKRIE